MGEARLAGMEETWLEETDRGATFELEFVFEEKKRRHQTERERVEIGQLIKRV